MSLADAYLGAGCIANPIDCYRIHTELNRLKMKIDLGDPLSPGEERWLEQHGVTLPAAAIEGSEDFKKTAWKGLWPFAAFFGALYLLKGKI